MNLTTLVIFIQEHLKGSSFSILITDEKIIFKSRECRKKLWKETKKKKEGLKLLKLENQALLILALIEYSLPHVFTFFMLFWHQETSNFMFHCLQNDDVIELDRFCQLIRIPIP